MWTTVAAVSAVITSRFMDLNYRATHLSTAVWRVLGLETPETTLTSVYFAVDFIASASTTGEVATSIKGRQSILPAQGTRVLYRHRQIKCQTLSLLNWMDFTSNTWQGFM